MYIYKRLSKWQLYTISPLDFKVTWNTSVNSKYLYTCVCLKIKPNIVRIRFLIRKMFCSSSMGLCYFMYIYDIFQKVMEVIIDQSQSLEHQVVQVVVRVVQPILVALLVVPEVAVQGPQISIVDQKTAGQLQEHL